MPAFFLKFVTNIDEIESGSISVWRFLIENFQFINICQITGIFKSRYPDCRSWPDFTIIFRSILWFIFMNKIESSWCILHIWWWFVSESVVYTYTGSKVAGILMPLPHPHCISIDDFKELSYQRIHFASYVSINENKKTLNPFYYKKYCW